MHCTRSRHQNVMTPTAASDDYLRSYCDSVHREQIEHGLDWLLVCIPEGAQCRQGTERNALCGLAWVGIQARASGAPSRVSSGPKDCRRESRNPARQTSVPAQIKSILLRQSVEGIDRSCTIRLIAGHMFGCAVFGFMHVQKLQTCRHVQNKSFSHASAEHADRSA